MCSNLRSSLLSTVRMIIFSGEHMLCHSFLRSRKRFKKMEKEKKGEVVTSPCWLFVLASCWRSRSVCLRWTSLLLLSLLLCSVTNFCIEVYSFAFHQLCICSISLLFHQLYTQIRCSTRFATVPSYIVSFAFPVDWCRFLSFHRRFACSLAFSFSPFFFFLAVFLKLLFYIIAQVVYIVCAQYFASN